MCDAEVCRSGGSGGLGGPWLTVDEVAGQFRVNPRVVASLLRDGEMPGVKIGKEWRICQPALIEYLRVASAQRSQRRVGESVPVVMGAVTGG